MRATPSCVLPLSLRPVCGLGLRLHADILSRARRQRMYQRGRAIRRAGLGDVDLCMQNDSSDHLARATIPPPVRILSFKVQIGL